MIENKLVFATNNAHKLEEVQAKVGNAFKIVSLTDVGCVEDIAETGITLEENASIKSQYINKSYGLNCFADDTGLEIKALNNEPGVYSARYSGSRDFKHNIDLVLLKMRDIIDRTARFRTVVSLIIDGKETLFEGIVNGKIRETPCGNIGFGYDPIFEPNGYSITFAEMDLEEKNKISHRGLAIEKLIEYLRNSL